MPGRQQGRRRELGRVADICEVKYVFLQARYQLSSDDGWSFGGKEWGEAEMRPVMKQTFISTSHFKDGDFGIMLNFGIH